MAVVRILGIDPGTRCVGFGCLELLVGDAPASAATAPLALRTANTVRGDGSGSLRLVTAGVLQLGGSERPVAERLLRLAERLQELLLELAPHEVALEEAFHGKSAQAALRIGEARGVVLAVAARQGIAIHQYPPARVKRCVTGNGVAGKAAVAAMVLNQLGALAAAAACPLPADATDALAVGLTRAEERRSPLLAQAAAATSLPMRPRGGRRRTGWRTAD